MILIAWLHLQRQMRWSSWSSFFFCVTSLAFFGWLWVWLAVQIVRRQQVKSGIASINHHERNGQSKFSCGFWNSWYFGKQKNIIWMLDITGPTNKTNQSNRMNLLTGQRTNRKSPSQNPNESINRFFPSLFFSSFPSCPLFSSHDGTS